MLDIEQTRFIAAEVVLILEFLRKCGIVHRDLKPENLLLDEKNHLKVIDFGTSKFLENAENGEFIKKVRDIKAKFTPVGADGQPEHRSSFVGTPIYLSPELIKEEEVSYAADLWALGVMIYFMLTGNPPFSNESDYDLYEAIKNEPVKFPENMDANAKDLITKLLDKNPATRLGSDGESKLDQTGSSGNGMAALKAHPFFKGIPWDTLRSTQSPIKKAVNPIQLVKQVDTDYYKQNQTRKKSIVLSGRVRKYKNYILYDTRQLILYDNGTLEYYNPDNNEKKVAFF